MTLGVGQPEQEHEVARLVQSEHDRGLANALSGYFGESPALTVSRGEDVLREIHNTNDYLKVQEGLPWPPPDPPYRLERTVASAQGNINQGWNAASQPGAAPGLQMRTPAVRNLDAGGMSYREALNYNPAPLTDNLGSLRGGSYQEPASELRPGFGRVDGARDILATVLIGLGAYGGYRLAEGRTNTVKVGATVGGLLAGWVVAAVATWG